jgi:hypothetical protein
MGGSEVVAPPQDEGWFQAVVKPTLAVNRARLTAALFIVNAILLYALSDSFKV